jgi:hypothetical protein
MALWSSRIRAFTSLEKAWKAYPRGYEGLRILVFNKQGQPVLQYSGSGATTEIDERECALGMELARSVYQSINSFSGGEPLRVAFYYENEVVTVERSDPFIIIVYWPPDAAHLESEITHYITRLSLTLQEELT